MTRSMLGKSVCTAIFLALQAPSILANPSLPTSAEAAAASAINNNPEVQAAWHALLAAEDAKDVARGGYFPKLDLNANLGRQDYEYHPTNTETEYDQRGVSLTLTQMLWDGLLTRNQVLSRDHTQRARYFEVRDAAQTVALEAYRAYQDVQRYRKLVALAQENHESHRRIYEQISDRVRAGISRSVDLQQVSGRLALAQSNLITEISNLHDVSARYERVVGAPPADQLSDAPVLDQGLPGTVSAALREAYTQHPSLYASVENIQANQRSMRSAKASYSPRLDLQLSTEHGNDLDRTTGRSDEQVAQLVLSYNLFNGGADKARVSQAHNETLRAQDLRDSACRNVRQTVRIAFNDSQRLQQQLRHLGVHQVTTEQAVSVYRDQFSLGQRTLLDLLDTENEAFEAQRAYIHAQFDRTIALARTQAGMGLLMPALGLSRNDLDQAGQDIGAQEATSRTPLCPLQPEKKLVQDIPKVAPVAVAPAAPVIVDSDMDGVNNEVDLCPQTPRGTPVNQVGCEKAKAIVLDGIRFRLSSSELLPQSRSVLDRAANTLLSNKAMRVEIQGHTDATGEASYNQKLSEQRAESVVRYLVNKGIAQQRLVAKGYGESRPIASNADADGRQKNRRVEFHILNADR